MKKAEIIPFFESTPSVELPHTIPGPDNFVIAELTVDCKLCGAALRDPHGTKTDRRDQTEFVLTALCTACRCVTQARVRIYTDGRVLHRADDGWNTHIFESAWDRVCRRVRAFFGWE